MKILRKKGNSYKKIYEIITKSTRKKFAQSWVFKILFHPMKRLLDTISVIQNFKQIFVMFKLYYISKFK